MKSFRDRNLISADGDSIFLTNTGSIFSMISLWWVISNLLCFASDSAIKKRALLTSSKTCWLYFGPVSDVSSIYDRACINYGLQTFPLKAEEFIISRNGRAISKPPRRDWNSDFEPVTTFYKLLVLITLSSPRGIPYIYFPYDSFIYWSIYGTIYDTFSIKHSRQHWTYLKLSLKSLSRFL